MLELLTLFAALALVGCLLLGVLGLAWIVRLAVRVVLLPLTLVGCLAQGVLGAVALAVGAVLLVTVGLPLLVAAIALMPLILGVAVLVVLAWLGFALLGWLV